MTLSTNVRPLNKLNEIVHQLYHFGYVDIFSTSELSSYQVKDILDTIGIKYTSDIGSVNGYKYIRIKIK